MNLAADLDAFLETITRLGGDVALLRVDPPATEAQVREVERKLDVVLPASFREVLLTQTSHVEFHWSLNDALILPDPLAEIFCGELLFGLGRMADDFDGYRGWLEGTWMAPEDPPAAIWHQKVPIQFVGNGDYIAIDTAGRVVYLSHDIGEAHGHVMAESFADLLARWLPLGCVGGECWQWLPFTGGGTTPIDPECENALAWRRLLSRGVA